MWRIGVYLIFVVVGTVKIQAPEVMRLAAVRTAGAKGVRTEEVVTP